MSSISVDCILAGSSAVTRCTPLLDALPTTFTQTSHPANSPSLFIWENTQSAATRKLLQAPPPKLAVSHLPHHQFLDSKAALATLQNEMLLRGGDVVQSFNLTGAAIPDFITTTLLANDNQGPPPSNKPNMWVIKDNLSNGAAGIWMLSPTNASLYTNSTTTPLTDAHSYVIQRYASPAMLFTPPSDPTSPRKAHVRIYGLLSHTTLAGVTTRAAHLNSKGFLHVSNKAFTGYEQSDHNDYQVHISNCCANSDDPAKFLGEICVDFIKEDKDPNSALYQSWGQLTQTFAAFGKAAATFTDVPSVPTDLCMFDYLGVDVIVTRTAIGNVLNCDVLEVNAPPSQDTATGIQAAEQVHDDSVGGILGGLVQPFFDEERTPEWRGWTSCYSDSIESTVSTKGSGAAPNLDRCTTINKLKFGMFGKRMARKPTLSEIVGHARQQFEYFSQPEVAPIFVENAGGSQVPKCVVESMTASLTRRWRDGAGAATKTNARKSLCSLLGAYSRDSTAVFGANASCLLERLAANLAVNVNMSDNIVVSDCNHTANIAPWKNLAVERNCGLVWHEMATGEGLVCGDAPVTAETKILVLPHCSNVLGCLYDVKGIAEKARKLAPGIIVVVDGVTAAPHRFVDYDSLGVDYYVVSMHKFFGPHIGAMVMRGENVNYRAWEYGTVNFEGCAGVIGVLEYVSGLGRIKGGGEAVNNKRALEDAYYCIELAEARVMSMVLNKIRHAYPKVTLVSHEDEVECFRERRRLPVIAFFHQDLKSDFIVEELLKKNVIGRAGSFLSEDCLERWAQGSGVLEERGGCVRVSLVHYNSEEEVEKVIEALEGIEGWW